jgi:hypothetical protein
VKAPRATGADQSCIFFLTCPIPFRTEISWSQQLNPFPYLWAQKKTQIARECVPAARDFGGDGREHATPAIQFMAVQFQRWQLWFDLRHWLNRGEAPGFLRHGGYRDKRRDEGGDGVPFRSWFTYRWQWGVISCHSAFCRFADRRMGSSSVLRENPERSVISDPQSPCVRCSSHRSGRRFKSWSVAERGPIRGYSWHKNEIKMIRRCHYSSDNFQDSTKRKITERKHGLSPKSAFFNAFQLGTK